MNNIKKILIGKKKKILFFIGPCSIHTSKTIKIFIKFINKINIKYKKKIIIIFRAYFEKPRTTIGWKGFIYDPYINGTYNINKGIKKTIKILKLLNNKNIKIISEIINNNVGIIIKKYINIGSIGARTCESQFHRELAQYLQIPFGYKNNSSGDIIVAINAIISNLNPNIYIFKNNNKINLQITKPQYFNFLIIRGGKLPNYKKNQYKKILGLINLNKIKTGICIDCNHANSKKIGINQIKICKYLAKNINSYKNLIGIMLEVNIKFGNQKIKTKINKYVSITDECISIIQCYKIIKHIYNSYLNNNSNTKK